jgi:seryl-tRNA synthetase
MLDIRYIREHPEEIQKKSEQKGYKVDVNELVRLDEEYRKLSVDIQEFSRQRNELIKLTKNAPGSEQIEKGRHLRRQEQGLIQDLDRIEKPREELLRSIPNVFPDDTPEGGEENNREEGKWGNTDPKNFELKDHLTWGEEKGLIDFERGAKVAGNKFYFLKGSLVEFELAVFQLGLKMAGDQGFTPFLVPHMVNTKTLEGAGFSARGEEKQIYKIEDEDLNLIATAEIPLTGYHADEIISESELPRLYIGLSPAYRVEGGAYGKYNRGLYRTHQFNKLELYVFCKPEESEQWHEKLVAMEESFCQVLEIPYRKVRIAAGDLGAPAYKKFDIEYWSPVDKSYRELMSCSNVTDYQCRRLNIRYKDASGQTKFLHSLNGTLAAMSRITIALIENHQTADGNVNIPAILQPYMQGKTQF